MNMKKNLGMYAFAMMAMASGNRSWDEPKETDEQRNARLIKAQNEIAKANGLKQFFYGSESVWAINQSVADKKAKKKNYI